MKLNTTIKIKHSILMLFSFQTGNHWSCFYAGLSLIKRPTLT